MPDPSGTPAQLCSTPSELLQLEAARPKDPRPEPLLPRPMLLKLLRPGPFL